MAKPANKLSAVALRHPEAGKHWDGGGLYLHVFDDGRRYWRLKYRFGGKEKLLALGVFPEVSLADARGAATAARKLLQDGVDPGEQRKQGKMQEARAARGTVAAVAKDWLAFRRKSWSPESARKAEFVLRAYLLPALGRERIDTLGSAASVAALRRIADQVPDLARKARQYLRGIVAFAIVEGLREDGKLLLLDGALPKGDAGHIAAATLPEDIAAVLRAVRAYPSAPTRAALLVCAFTAQRPGNVVSMRWDEISGAEWRIPADKMKMRQAHIVPMPKQAQALLEEMRAFSAGRDFVFPPLARQQCPHLHRDALSKALRSLGFQGKHATHGFRAAFRTLGRERLGIAEDVLEAQLAHAKRGNVARAYDRTSFTEERRRSMQSWADYLDGLTADGKVTPFRPNARRKPAAA